MKRNLIVLLVLTGTSPNIHGASLLAYPGQWFQDTSNSAERDFKNGALAIEQGISNLGKAAADVVTLGEEGRRRDRDRFEYQRELAQQGRAKAKELREAAQKAKKNELANAEVRINDLTRHQESLAFLRSRVEKNMQFTSDLIASVEGQEMHYETLKRVMNGQLQDLIDWTQAQAQPHLPSGSGTTDEFSQVNQFLIEKISLYSQQLAAIPGNPGQIMDSEMMYDLLSAGFEVLKVIDAAAANNAALIQQTTDYKTQIENQLEALG